MKEIASYTTACAIAFAICLLMCAKIIDEKKEDIEELKHQAIELEHAYHHPKTGEFTWKEKGDE